MPCTTTFPLLLSSLKTGVCPCESQLFSSLISGCSRCTRGGRDRTEKQGGLFTVVLFFPSQNLPVEEIYTPALNIRVRDNRTFGRRPIVGVHSVKSIQQYRCPTPQVTEEVDSGPGKAPPPKGRKKLLQAFGKIDTCYTRRIVQLCLYVGSGWLK